MKICAAKENGRNGTTAWTPGSSAAQHSRGGGCGVILPN